MSVCNADTTLAHSPSSRPSKERTKALDFPRGGSPDKEADWLTEEPGITALCNLLSALLPPGPPAHPRPPVLLDLLPLDPVELVTGILHCCLPLLSGVEGYKSLGEFQTRSHLVSKLYIRYGKEIVHALTDPRVSCSPGRLRGFKRRSFLSSPSLSFGLCSLSLFTFPPFPFATHSVPLSLVSPAQEP